VRVPFSPAPGIISDDTDFAEEGLYNDGNNMRPWRGKMQTIGSWQTAFSSTLTGVCRNVLLWTDTAGNAVTAFGTHSKLQVYFAGALSDITPSGLTAGSIDTAGDAPGYGSGSYGMGTYSTPDSIFYARTWSLQTWGQTLLANPRGGTLYQWSNNPAVVAAEITQAPDNITAIVVTPQRQVLALGCNEEGSGTFNPLCIRGCDLEDVADWTTAADNNAFEHILTGAGKIITGRMVGPYVVVWTDTGLYIGQYLGNPGQTYRFDPVAVNCGLVGPNAVWVDGMTCYWVAPDLQWRIWQPGAQPNILECPIRSDFTDNVELAQAAKIVASGIAQYGEVWFYYPDSRDGIENSRYMALSTLISSTTPRAWFRGQIARTAAVDAGVAIYPTAVTYDGIVYSHERGPGSVSWSLSTAYQYIGNAEKVLQIQGMIPDFEDQSGDVSLSMTARREPQQTATSHGPYLFAEGQRKKDFRVSANILALQWSGTGYVRFGKPVFDAKELGRR